MKISRILPILLFAASVPPAPAWADTAAKKTAEKTAAPHASAETEFGKQGDPKKATRTIRIDMSDKMRFIPDALKVKQGETVKFVVRNSGKVLHEMVLGTGKELREHAELMRRFPGMEHDETNMLHVRPGKSRSFTWQFTRAGEFRYACLIPGHFEAGMIGSISVTPE